MKKGGIGDGEFDYKRAVKHGAIVINGVTNKVIAANGRTYPENDLTLANINDVD